MCQKELFILKKMSHHSRLYINCTSVYCVHIAHAQLHRHTHMDNFKHHKELLIQKEMRHHSRMYLNQKQSYDPNYFLFILAISGMRKRTHIHTRPPKHGKELLILKTMSCHSRLYLNLKQSYVYKHFYVYCICNNKYTLFRSLTYIEVKVIQSENRSQTYILVHGTHCYNMTVYYNDIKCIINTLWGKFCIQDLNIYLGH